MIEFVNGGDLMFHMQRQRRLPEEHARFYAAEICLALNFLHEKGKYVGPECFSYEVHMPVDKALELGSEILVLNVSLFSTWLFHWEVAPVNNSSATHCNFNG